jgi:hypothetical protein
MKPRAPLAVPVLHLVQGSTVVSRSCELCWGAGNSTLTWPETCPGQHFFLPPALCPEYHFSFSSVFCTPTGSLRNVQYCIIFLFQPNKQSCRLHKPYVSFHPFLYPGPPAPKYPPLSPPALALTQNAYSRTPVRVNWKRRPVWIWV